MRPSGAHMLFLAMLLTVSTASAYRRASVNEAVAVADADDASHTGAKEALVMGDEEVKGLIKELRKVKFDSFEMTMETVARKGAALSMRDAIGRLSLPPDVVEVAHHGHGGGAAMLQEPGAAAGGNGTRSFMVAPTPAPTFTKGSKLEKAMNFLNGEFKDIRKKMDVKLFECGFYKVETEGHLDLVQADIVSLAQSIGLLESKISNFQAEIISEQRNLNNLEMELQKIKDNCQETREALRAEEALIQDDREVAQLIIEVARKECDKTKLMSIKACRSSTGATEFTTGSDELQSAISELKTPAAQAAVQRVLFESSGLEEDELPGEAPPVVNQMAWKAKGKGGATVVHHKKNRAKLFASLQLSKAKKAAPAAKVATAPTSSAAEKFCPIGVKPNCDPLLDKLGSMLGDILENLSKKQSQIHKHNQKCEESIKNMKTDIAESQEAIGVANVELQQTTAEKQTKIATQTQRIVERHQICELMREKYEECHKEIKGLEEELCGIFKVRQGVYQQLNKGESPDIQDCMVGPWVSGECSKSCLGAGRVAGSQTMAREIVADNNTYGATCPPMKLTRTCGNVECPVDCVLDLWTGWGKCTKDCGGGSETRTRTVTTNDAYGGTPCDTTEEARACNTASCDQDCTLRDWSGWTPCAKACRAEPTSDAGRQYRKRTIKTTIKGSGECPKPDSRMRYGYRVCNAMLCPEKMECIAPMDLIILMDGSGSLFHRAGKPYDANFAYERQYVAEMIEHSIMDGNKLIDQDEKPPTNVRIGVLQFGGWMYNRRKFLRRRYRWSYNRGARKWTRSYYGKPVWQGGWEGKPPRVVSKLTGDKKAALAAVKKEKWMRGFTPTDKAVDKAMSMLQYSMSDRMQGIVIITDGAPTDPPRTERVIAAARDKGIRVVIIAAGQGGAMSVGKSTVCGLASSPCADNAEYAFDWSDLKTDFNRFFINSCPAVKAGNATAAF